MTLSDYNYHTLPLRDDYEGKVVATLCEAKANTGGRPAVLYLHGFVDYFFQAHLGEAVLAAGYDFYALDLRKCGRSWLAHQHPNYCRSMEEYFEEIDTAIETIGKRCPSVYLLGHSTGGLLAAFYMHKGLLRHRVERLVLNSPFLAFNIRPRVVLWLGKAIAGPLSRLWPYSNLSNALTPVYPGSIHKDYYGEWDFDLRLKPIKGFPAYYAWVQAVLHAQKELRQGTGIEIPILILHSTRSFIPHRYTPEVQTADIVLNIGHIRHLGSKLGRQVTLAAIDRAKHDVFLSEKGVRNKAFAAMLEWLKA